MLADFFGQEFKVGQIIAYPASWGRSNVTHVGIVTAVPIGNVSMRILLWSISHYDRNDKPTWRKTVLHNHENAVVVSHIIHEQKERDPKYRELWERSQEIAGGAV
jgi:hypothetical protein